ncbi:signal recognition particle subunit srp68 [Perkinsus chesapeaki]|uniref:Signal recognition particle subunit SRP68 n=1 Tax=Perkinsus chesapeaki TaxID=330153 RepID=A0A7J6MP54_PERCH|nr:signal recognition particle subunit srp68 [Perkinsus chesapeaki]
MASSTDAAISQPAVGPSHEPFSINILVRVKTMQQQNGLRRQDYHRYRQYCTRRLHRIRKATKLTNGRDRFKKCTIPEDFTIDKILEIPLVSAERAWAYAAELLGVYAQFIEDKPALKYHGIGRLRKAVSYSQILLAMCRVHCDSRTVMEAEAYESFMSGVLEFNLENYTAALKKLTAAKDLYQKLSVLTTSKTEGELKMEKAYYAQMLDSDIAPKLRQCRYYADEDGHHPVEKKVEGAAVKEGAKASKSQVALLQQIDATKAKGDARGDVMSLEDYYNATDDAVASAIDGCSEVAGLCQEVLSKVHSEMVKSEEESGGVDWAAHEVEMRKVSDEVSGERSLLLIYGLLAKIRSLNVWIGTSKGRMSVKPEEGVRLCDMLLDTQEGRAEKQAIKDLRLFFLALSHASAGKVPEAISLLQLLEQRTSSQLTPEDTRMSRAAVSLRSDLLPAAATQWRLKCLLQLVAEKGGHPVEAPAATDSAKLFPPPLQPMPSKPLVIDMAFDYITPPDLSKEVEEHKPQKEAASTGLLGRLGGWWGGGRN